MYLNILLCSLRILSMRNNLTSLTSLYSFINLSYLMSSVVPPLCESKMLKGTLEIKSTVNQPVRQDVVIVLLLSISFKLSSTKAEKKITITSIKNRASKTKPTIVCISYPSAGVVDLAKAISTGVIKHEIKRTNIMKSSQICFNLFSGQMMQGWY